MAGGKRKIAEYNAELTPEERKESAKKAAAASVEVRQKRKSIVADLNYLLSLPLRNEKTKRPLEKIGAYSAMDCTIRTSVVAALVAKAIEGNVEAIKTIMDIVGTGAVEAALPVKVEIKLEDTSGKDNAPE